MTQITVEHLTNQYDCDRCGASWEDDWCCACDDECPQCGADVSPSDSEVNDTFTLEVGKTICPVCDSPHEF